MNAQLRFVRLLCGLTWLAAAIPAGAADAPPANPPAYRWQNVVIKGGGFVSGLLYHPAERDLLYARTDVGGAFRWNSAASRWVALNDSLGPDDAQLLGVVSLAVDAGDSQRLYLACGSYLPAWGKPAALLSSADRGATWNRVPLPFNLGGNADGREAGERLQVDPHDGTLLFLGTNQDGLWRSGDHARTWRRVDGFPGVRLTFVLFDPASGTDGKPTPTLYAGSADMTKPVFYRSTDAGATWAPVPGQPAGYLIQHAAFDPSGILYLTYANNFGPNDTTDGMVWKYAPAEGHWTDITPIAPTASAHDGFSYAGLAVDARHAGTVMVSTLDRWSHGDEIFRSIDGGASWKPVLATSTWDHSAAPYTNALKPHWIGAVALDPFDADRAFFVTGYGVWATSRASAVDRGAPTPWNFSDAGLEETVVADLVSPPAGAPLLSALYDLGGFRHDDLTVSPAAGMLQASRGTGAGIAFAERLPAKLVRTHSGFARGAVSLDGGLTWKDFATMPPPASAKGPGKIALACDGRRLVWLVKGAAPYFSGDDGASWVRSDTSFTAPDEYRETSPAADSVNPGKFYVYDFATGRIHVSVDGGGKFSATATLPPGGGALRAEPGTEGRVWVPTPGGLFRSGDSGRIFQAVPSVQQADQLGFGRAAPGKTTPAIFLAGQVGGHRGLFRSDDDGLSWMALNEATLQFGWINAVSGDPRAYGRVYVGTGGRGIFCGEMVSP